MNIELHKHHIKPKHMGGNNDPNNLIELTIEDHAIAHKILYGLYGKKQDLIAYQTLSGQIGQLEARKRAAVLANTGRKLSDSHKMKLSLAHKGKISGNKGKNQIAWNKGKPFPISTRQRMSQSKIGKPTNNPDGGVPPFQKNTIWINNGIINKKINYQSTIPSGWVRGMK